MRPPSTPFVLLSLLAVFSIFASTVAWPVQLAGEIQQSNPSAAVRNGQTTECFPVLHTPTRRTQDSASCSRPFPSVYCQDIHLLENPTTFGPGASVTPSCATVEYFLPLRPRSHGANTAPISNHGTQLEGDESIDEPSNSVKLYGLDKRWGLPKTHNVCVAADGEPAKTSQECRKAYNGPASVGGKGPKNSGNDKFRV